MDGKALIKSGTAWSGAIAFLPTAWGYLTIAFPKLRIISTDDVSQGVSLAISAAGFIGVLWNRIAGNKAPITGLLK